MIKPKYRITHSILNNIVTFEKNKIRISNKEVSDDLVHRLRLDANSKDVFYIANLLGLNTTLKEAKKISSGKNILEQDKKINYLINFRNANEYILATQSSYFPDQSNLLIHLNKILIKNIAEDWDAKYRIEGDSPSETENDWLEISDNKFPAVKIQTESQKAIDWFSENQSRIHPFISIPSTLYKLIRITPFFKANKLTILSICKYLFYKSKMNVEGFFSVIKFFAIHKSEIVESLKTSSLENDDITSFIELFASSYSKELESFKDEFNKILEQSKEKKKQPFLDLNKRQLKILRYLQNIPQIKREEYIEIMDVSTMTAYRDLSELVKKGLLRIEGKGRGTKYMLANR